MLNRLNILVAGGYDPEDPNSLGIPTGESAGSQEGQVLKYQFSSKIVMIVHQAIRLAYPVMPSDHLTKDK